MMSLRLHVQKCPKKVVCQKLTLDAFALDSILLQLVEKLQLPNSWQLKC